MSPKRISQQIANLCPVSARPVLVALAAFVALGAFASLLLLLSPGPAPVTAAPMTDPALDFSGPLQFMTPVTPTTTTLTRSPSGTTVYGQTITFYATVTHGVGVPVDTGTVFFNDGGVTIGTAALNASGVATLTTFRLAAGAHEMTAVYHGDGTYEESESATLTHTVDKANTATTIDLSGTTPVFGQCLTFTATVAVSETMSTPATAGTPTGIVTFQDVFTDTAGTFTTTIGSGTLNGEGVAGFTTCSLAVGDHTIIATYEGDANFNQSQTSMTFTVDKAATTTGIVDAVPSPSVYGESVTFTAVVSPTLPGAGTPTGKVTFKVDGTAEFTAMLGFTNPGEARWSTTPGDSTELDTDPADGDHKITAHYSGDGNFNTSASAVFTQTVNKANTTVQLQIPLPETEFGQDVRMSAIVSVKDPGAGTPTGTVVFTVATVPPIVMTGTLPDGGTSVTVMTNTIPVGTWDVEAEYGGDDHFNGDTSDAVEHKVNKADSETSLESSANPSDFGQTVTFTATVEPAGLGLFASVEPTGTVTFTLGTVGTMTGTLDASGVATVVTDTLPAGEHEVTAEYGGDTNFKPSDDSLRQKVNRIATTTTLSGPSSSVIGESVTFTATVTATGGITPTGTVAFWDFATVLTDTVTLDASGVATYTTSSLSAGTHRLKAVYNGTSDFSPSSSERLLHTVGVAGTTTTLSRSPSGSVVYGQTITFTAKVTETATGDPVTSGTVTFKDDATTLGSGTLDASGMVTLTKSSLAAGNHAIKAIFAGNASFAGSESAVMNLTVDQADTSTTVTSSPNPESVFGQSVTITATVTISETVDTPGAGTPTGTVTFTVDSTVLGTATLNGAGRAVLTTSAIPVGASQTITATYGGSNNFDTSSGTTTHTVNKAHTKTTVTSSPNPSIPDQEVTITAIVTVSETVATPGAGTPTGTVEFKVNSTSLGSKSLVNGSASTTYTFTVTGTFTIKADYTNTDGNFEDSNGSSTHDVNATPPDLSVTKVDSPDPVNAGDDLTYLINVTNNGDDPVNVTLVDTLPSDVTFVSATPDAPTCTETAGIVTCNLGALAGHASTSVTIIVNVPADTPAGTVLSNKAEVGAQSDTEETTVYRSPRAGDCNGDDAVTLADIWSIVRDIFDPTYVGTTGCDANKDKRVDAGDVPSTVLIMFRGLNAGGTGRGLNSPAEGPALTMIMPDQESVSPGGLMTVQVTFAANGHSITSLAFSVDYDETWLALDPTDSDGNGIPDRVIFSLPGDFTASVTFDEGDSDGEVDIFIGDISPPLTSLSDGPIVFLILNVGSSPGETQGAVLFSLDPAASFGDTSGQSVPGTATPTVRQYQIYLPMLSH